MRKDIDAKITRIKKLIAKREELDAELHELFGGAVHEKRSSKYSRCGEPGHRASTCPSKQYEPPLPELRKPASADFRLRYVNLSVPAEFRACPRDVRWQPSHCSR